MTIHTKIAAFAAGFLSLLTPTYAMAGSWGATGYALAASNPSYITAAISVTDEDGGPVTQLTQTNFAVEALGFGGGVFLGVERGSLPRAGESGSYCCFQEMEPGFYKLNIRIGQPQSSVKAVRVRVFKVTGNGGVVADRPGSAPSLTPRTQKAAIVIPISH